MNKKAFSSVMLTMIAFLVLSMTFIFTSVMYKEAGEQFLITPTADIGRGILANTTSIPASQGVDTITALENRYIAFNFPYDLFFLVLWISVFTSTVVAAFRSNKEGIFSFFGFIFIGSLILLLITGYMADFASWFMGNVFYAMFADVTVSLPIFTFYINNLGLIHFIWWLILVLVNIVDKSFISKTGEVEQ
ncbi:MAG: hypothetical protein MJK08_14640 [Campylobacterales bacterium]|nr:hypothetical protein [Campylobacterales bacterium]